MIAICKEDLSWIEHVAHEYEQVFIYDKCGRNPKFDISNVTVIHIPNIGSCDNAFLTYIIDNYGKLPDIVEFTKGNTHKDRHRLFNCNKKCKSESGRNLLRFKLSNYRFTHNPSQDFEFVRSGYDNMRDWVASQENLNRDMYKRTGCIVRYGGHFAATKTQILSNPKELYEELRKQQAHPNEEIDHYIERTWGVLMCDSTKRNAGHL